MNTNSETHVMHLVQKTLDRLTLRAKMRVLRYLLERCEEEFQGDPKPGEVKRGDLQMSLDVQAEKTE